jgi:hypothetical protein
MGKRQVTTIEIEKYETLIIRQPRQILRPVCQECGAAKPMILPEEAATLAEVSLRAIFRWVETVQVHFCEMADGRLYLCSDSLPPSEVHPPTTE